MAGEPARGMLPGGRGVLLHCLGYVGCVVDPGADPHPLDAALHRGAAALSALAPTAIRPLRIHAPGLRVVALIATAPGPAAEASLHVAEGCVLACGPVCSEPGPEHWAAAVLAGQWPSLGGQDGTYCAVAWSPDLGLVLGQDAFGLRPQYRFQRRDRSLWFASTLRGLVALPELADPELNWDSQLLQVVRLPRAGEMSVFRGPERSRGAEVLRFAPHRAAPQRHVPAAPYGGAEPLRAGPEELVEALNEALLRRLRQTLAQVPDTIPRALLLSGGLDSRWIGAALRSLGQRHEAFVIGGRLDADVECARAVCRLHGVPLTVGDSDRRDPTLAPVGEAIWWQDSAVSPYHCIAAEVWPALRDAGAFVMHGYFQNWLKWGRPGLRDLAPWRQGPPPPDRPAAAAHEVYQTFARDSCVALLAPDIAVRVREAVARNLQGRVTVSRGDAVSLLAMDHGPQEPFTALGRFGYALGGAGFPLPGRDTLRWVRAALALPPHQRVRIQARCLLALAPEEADLPTMRFLLPTRVLAAGYGALPGHLARDPGWYRRWRAVARHPSPDTTRLARLRDPAALSWAQRMLFADDSQALAHFRGRLSDFWRAATAPAASWRAVSLLYGLAGREYYRRCWRRAGSGDTRPWQSEPGPGSPSSS